MWRISVCVALLSVSFFSSAGQFQLFSENGKVGLKDEQGQVVVPPAYEALGWSDGSFSMAGAIIGYRLQQKWGLLHVQKQKITKAEYVQLLPAGGDYFLAARTLNSFTTKFGLLTAEGKATIPFYYDGLQITGLRAIVFNKNGNRYEHGVVSLTDQRVIPLKYKSITALGTLRYAVENFDGKVALFSEAGVPLTDFQIDSIGSFYRDHAIVYQDLRQGLISRAGDWVAMPTYQHVWFDEGWRGQRYPQWKEINTRLEEHRELEADDLKETPPFVRVRNTNRYGLLTADWKMVLPVRYERLEPAGPHWVAQRQGKFALLRPNGSVVLPHRFDSLFVQQNLIRAVERPWGEPVWSVYDTFGIRKTKRYYQHIAALRQKLFVVKADGFYGAVDRYGNETVACVYDSILQIKDEKLVVVFKGLYGIVSTDDRWLLLPQPHPVEIVADDYYVQREPAASWLKRLDGKVVYFSMNPLHVADSLLREKISGQPDRLINLQGQVIQPAAAELAHVTAFFAEHEGMRGILRDGRYGFIDGKGKLRVANRYEGIGYFSEGLAPVKILGRWGFVNAKDQVIINPNYDSVSSFSADRAIASRDGRWGVINKKGEWVLQPRYQHVKNLTDGDYEIEWNGAYGLANRQGMVLIEPRFDSLQILPTGDVLVRQLGKFGLLSREGLSKIPLVYEALIYQPATQTFLARTTPAPEKIFP
jgi:hypothetical protein